MAWLDRALFVAPIHYALCMDEGAFQRELSRLKVPASSRPPFVAQSAAATVHFFEETDGARKSAIVCMRPPRNGANLADTVALLAHESMHIWREIRETIGEDRPSSEFEAYCLQGIVARLVDAFLNTDEGKRCLRASAKAK